VFAVLQDNLGVLCGKASGHTGEQEWRSIRSDVFRFLNGLQGLAVYDIVFADPPYDRIDEVKWAMRLLDELARQQVLAENGVFVMEQAREEAAALHPAWDVMAMKEYGGTRLTVYGRRQI